MTRPRPLLFFAGLLALLGGTVLLGLWFGSGRIPAADLLDALLHPGGDTPYHVIVWNFRFPRVLLALLVGGGLAASGCVFQGMLRNPLADPYTLGISGGAALGASLAIIAGLGSSMGAVVVPVFAFAGALLSISLVYAAARRRHFTAVALILGGIILNFFFSSLVYMLFAFARSSEIHGAMNWLMGDLGAAQGTTMVPTAAMVGAGFAVFFYFGRDLNALALGDEKASNLGTSPERTRKILFFAASLVTGACVASAGVIGFVGLLLPHMLRPFTGPDHRALLPASLMGGGIFLCLSDLLARAVPSSIAFPEFPVGVVTGILGGLFLLVLLFSGRITKFF
jgi:iron complex transport system permease protein